MSNLLIILSSMSIINIEGVRFLESKNIFKFSCFRLEQEINLLLRAIYV